jgi:hypothetical protein
MKKIIFIVFSLLIFACGNTRSTAYHISPNSKLKVVENDTTKENTNRIAVMEKKVDWANTYAEKMTEENLKKLVFTLASDSLHGRRTGEKGQKMAARFIANYYKNLGLAPANLDGSYLQRIPKAYFIGRSKNDSENVIAYLKGTEKPNEFVIISAHYDHLGIREDNVFNGADDDASGTSAVMEIARVFKNASKEGNGPKRSIVFLNVTGEEEGLFGSNYYVEHPVFPLMNTVVDLNIDMIGRFDKQHEDNPEFVYLIGADKLSKELHKLSEAANDKYTQLKLDYTYNDENDPNRFYYRSDHYNFAKNNIPIIFYFNGVHSDYHRSTDTADKIRYDLLKKRAQLIFYTAWEIANRDERLVVDKH